MGETGLPPEVREFVNRHVASMRHLDLLLLLRAGAGRAWTAGEAAREAGMEGDAAAAVLRDLVADALVTPEGHGAAAVYRYAPESPGLAAGCDALAEAYNRVPVQLIRAVYERPPMAVQALADAFRIRR